MNLSTHLLILSILDPIFGVIGRFVYVNKNLTYMAAWKRCHESYKGKLANLDKWNYSSQSLLSPCIETDGFFWHGSLIKSFPWIYFEGCYSYVNYSDGMTMPYSSLAWCQNKCKPYGSYFAVQSNLCLCDVNVESLSQVDSTQCNISCDDSAMCGGNSYISLYSRVPQSTYDLSDFDSPEYIDKQCLAYRCASIASVKTEAAKCTDLLHLVCESSSGRFHSQRREPWLTSNILCTKTLTTPKCRNVTNYSNWKSWTDIFRVQDQFKDEVSMTIVEVERFLSGSFYTNEREGRHIIFSDGLKEYPSLCETDISDEQLIDEDRICNITSSTEIGQKNIKRSGLETTVIVGVSIFALIAVVGLTKVFCRVKSIRQQSEVVKVQMETRISQDGRNTFSRSTVSESSLTYSNADTHDGVRNSPTRNHSGYSCVRMNDGAMSNCNVNDIPLVYSKARNNRQNDNQDAIFNDIEDTCIAATSNLPAKQYFDDGVYKEIDPEQGENETLNGDEDVYVEVHEGVYDILNASTTRRNRDGIKNVYDMVYKKM